MYKLQNQSIKVRTQSISSFFMLLYFLFIRNSIFLYLFFSGDLVIARSPVNPHTFVCKRIVAKTDDLVYDEHENLVKVCCRRKQIWQKFITRDFFLILFQIPKGYVWLEGDNADDSIDSRRYGKSDTDLHTQFIRLISRLIDWLTWMNLIYFLV